MMKRSGASAVRLARPADLQRPGGREKFFWRRDQERAGNSAWIFSSRAFGLVGVSFSRGLLICSSETDSVRGGDGTTGH